MVFFFFIPSCQFLICIALRDLDNLVPRSLLFPSPRATFSSPEPPVPLLGPRAQPPAVKRTRRLWGRECWSEREEADGKRRDSGNELGDHDRLQKLRRPEGCFPFTQNCRLEILETLRVKWKNFFPVVPNLQSHWYIKKPT